MRKTTALVAAALILMGAAACSDDREPASQAAAAEADTEAAFTAARTFGEFQPGQPAITYDTTLIPNGAKAQAKVTRSATASTVVLTVNGLLPDHKYGAHVHVKSCGAKPADAGPHYQHKADPVMPSVDPKYANAKNEVWLDITTDGKGHGESTAQVDWDFRKGEANSVIIHAEHTKTEPAKAGTAGARSACLNVPL